MNDTSSSAPGFLCIGHRGACGHAPENTLKSFALALDMGCPWIELDVYAVEGELVVIHDDDLRRTTNGRGKVMDSSLSYLRSLDAGDGEQIPLLKEVFDLVDKRAGINIELKGPHTAQPVNQLLEQYLDDGWSRDQLLISSFDHEELAMCSPQYARGALFGRKADRALERSLNLGAWSANLSLRTTTPELVDSLKGAGLNVLVYTVNDAADIQAMLDMGVDGVFTDYPDRVFALTGQAQ